ncbi:unnamed protein product [Paramecium sonneborni]|uniref:Uncharacterized protein n=1 Tax=Paramecium sonneborni TaxID=65129 RepID=A0A8S1RKG2_9CILI|nr:unnamed protein product [Paramecium sonneborni]
MTKKFTDEQTQELLDTNKIAEEKIYAFYLSFFDPKKCVGGYQNEYLQMDSSSLIVDWLGIDIKVLQCNLYQSLNFYELNKSFFAISRKSDITQKSKL